MSSFKLSEIHNLFLVSTGTIGTTISFWAEVDLAMGLILKFVSLASFIIFILINQDNISNGWTKFISKFKSNK